MSSLQTPLPSLIGESPAFLDTLQAVSLAAQVERPLLIIGERGTGKELIGERVHFLSQRWDGPLVKINCAALSEDLLDSELFGHEAGAFTGAKGRRPGRFERAEGGTLFLDEIGTASVSVQEKLLRVIEYGEYERVGGSETLSCNVRIVGATNANLNQAVEEGKFRADLLDRLAFDVIPIPPMRARKEDILPLANFYASRMASELGYDWIGFEHQAQQQLLNYEWPGNVRELKNVAERSCYRYFGNTDEGQSQTEGVNQVIFNPFESPWPLMPAKKIAVNQDSIEGKALDAQEVSLPKSQPQLPDQGYNLEGWLNQIEKEAVVKALAQHDGHQKQTASYLQLTYDQMRGLVRKHGLSDRKRTPSKSTRTNN